MNKRQVDRERLMDLNLHGRPRARGILIWASIGLFAVLLALTVLAVIGAQP